ncbi:MAG TPA: HAMP domain-containing sensor histidine kinase [Verrucomicrobiales bacterium]|nr:HAMP domain-containing sensor histidine kinase [Verrucomicrobiales bacterium]
MAARSPIPSRFRSLLLWSLLVVPSVVLGGVALRLLSLEQTRVREAGLHTVRDRAATIAENLDLAAGEIRSGLMDTLSSFPAESLSEELPRWNVSNGFVSDFLVCDPGGAVLAPTEAPSQITLDLCNSDGLFVWNAEPALSNNLGTLVYQTLNTTTEEELNNKLLAGDNYGNFKINRAQLREKTGLQQGAIPEPPSDAGSSLPGQPDIPQQAASAQKGTFVDVSDRGWVYRDDGSRTRAAAWYRPHPAAPVRIIQVDVDLLVQELTAAFPNEPDSAERYELRDPGGRVLHASGVESREAPAFILPVGDSLPDWNVAAYHIWESSPGSRLFLLGALGLGILLTSAVAGSSLLVRQSRRDALEAVQKTTFVSNVSHELKTPLTSIRMYAELLAQQRSADPAKTTRYLGVIVSESQRLTRLVNNVLNFARLDQRRRAFDLRDQDLVPVLRRVLDDQKVMLERAGLELRTDIPALPLFCSFEEDAFEQILLNLLDNAAKYAAEGLRLEVSAASLDSGARVTVRDYGPGIPGPHREAVFKEFHRVETSLSAGVSGTGLGLSIARRLARGFGGDLGCCPAPDGGACFEITLPPPQTSFKGLARPS